MLRVEASGFERVRVLVSRNRLVQTTGHLGHEPTVEQNDE